MSSLLYRLGIVISILFTLCSIGLLVVGANCHNNNIWITDAAVCENIYISGIVLTFISLVWILFGLMFYFVEYFDQPLETTVAPAKRQSTIRVNPVRRASMV